VNTISEQLKHAREEKGLSLNDIAALTRINRRFLKAIEENNFDVVPPAYLRSFIRAFAHTVELDADKLFHSFEKNKPENIPDEQANEQTGIVTNESSSGPSEQVAEIIAEKTGENHRAKKKSLQRQDYVKGIVLFALLLGVVFVVSKFSAKEEKNVEEIPFDEIVKENEAVAARKDSLRLVAVAMDSVWIIVRVDGKLSTKVTLAKNEKASFSSKKKFSVTASDAGKIHFTLNNRFIGALGREGTILRNSILDKETLQRFDKKGNIGTLQEEKEDSSGVQ